MVRRAEGSYGRRSLPGVRRLVLRQFESMNRAFCLEPLGGPCSWCEGIADLSAGIPFDLSGSIVFGAMCSGHESVEPLHDLQNDSRRWRIVGDDWIHPAPQESAA